MIQPVRSKLCEALRPVGRILEQEDYYIWGCSPIYGEDGRVHVFYSRWPKRYGFDGWVEACEVAHAVADTPEQPFETVGVALAGSGEGPDAWSVHNPTIHKVDGRYVLLYMGSTGEGFDVTRNELPELPAAEHRAYYEKLVETKRVCMAVSDSLDGPWQRLGVMVETGDVPSWDDFCTSNPAFVKTPGGKYRIYYKAWDSGTAARFNGNRKYGFAEADKLEGPYVKFPGNPVVEYAYIGERIQAEDGYMWHEDGEYRMIMRDMGVFNQEYGLYIHSADGVQWSEPQIAWLDAGAYFDEDVSQLERKGLERPQLLKRDGHPDYLFCAHMGGRYGTSSGVVLKIER